MSKVLVTESYLDDIADAIRNKNGTENTYKPSQMAAAIEALPGPSTLGMKIISENGSYDPASDNLDGYSGVTVNVPNSYSAGDEGKVVSSGALVSQTSVTKTENGTYDTTLNNQVVVNVPSATLVSKSITENGTYYPEDDNADGYSSVIVNVSGCGGSDFSHEEAFLLTDYIASNGTQFIDTGYIVKDNSVFDIVCYDGYYSGRLNSVYGVRNGDQSGGCSLWFTGDTSQAQFQWSSGIGANEMYLSDKAYNYVKIHIIAKKSGLSLCSHSTTSKPSDVYTDEKIVNTKTGSATQTYSLYLFGLNQGGSDYGFLTRGNVRIYRFRIYEGSILVHEFIPWKDSSNVVCMKDTVTGNLKYNAGTGAFTYGTDT